MQWVGHRHIVEKIYHMETAVPIFCLHLVAFITLLHRLRHFVQVSGIWRERITLPSLIKLSTLWTATRALTESPSISSLKLISEQESKPNEQPHFQVASNVMHSSVTFVRVLIIGT